MNTAILVGSSSIFELVYGVEGARRISQQSNLLGTITNGATWRDNLPLLAEAEVLFTSWAVPAFDAEFLAAIPKVRAIFHAAGSVRPFATEELWRSDIRLFSAAAQNAVPVAEFATSAIHLGLKRVWAYANRVRQIRTFPEGINLPGAYGTKVGLISYGLIARLVRERLRTSKVDVLVYDPFLPGEEATRENVQCVGLDDIFSICDAISVHTPMLPETHHLIQRRHFALMKQNAVFINTARGGVVDENGLIEELKHRPDLQAILDVTDPEPPESNSPLYDLPNVVLTPHLAGSRSAECRRMSDAMIEEFIRFQNGLPTLQEIPKQRRHLLA